MTLGPDQSEQTKTVASTVSESPSSARSVIGVRQRSPGVVTQPAREHLTPYQNGVSVGEYSSERAFENAPRGRGVHHGCHVDVNAPKSDGNEDSCLVSGAGSRVREDRSAGREVRW